MLSATIEYNWTGYTRPNAHIAAGIKAAIARAKGAVSTQSQFLADIRQELEDAGLHCVGSNMVKNRDGAGTRWLPLWREIWSDKQTANSHLSPAASKARAASEGERRLRWPSLARTSTNLVLATPVKGGSEYQAKFAAMVSKDLPVFKFAPKRNWWTAPLTRENYDAVIEANTYASEVQIRMSDGAKALWKGDTMKNEGKLLACVRHAAKKYPQLGTRSEKAGEIVRKGVTQIGVDLFRVKSQSSQETYTVDLERRSCTCYDWQNNAPVICQGKMCKHRLAALLYIKIKER